MKIQRSALGLVFLVSLSIAKTIPTSEPISKATEKKSVEQEEPTKPEAPEAPAAIAVETAEESKQTDRTKKSATTTFCVEIRPGASDGPVKVCDEHNPPPAPPSEPQIPNPPQNLHQETYHEEHEHLPLLVVPPNPLAVYIPNDGPSFVNCPPQLIHQNNQVQTVTGNGQHIIIPSPASFPCPSLSPPSQHIIIPSPGSVNCPSVASSSGQHIVIPSPGSALCPCQSASTNGLYPPTLVSLFRSAIARNDDNLSPAYGAMDSTMEMRSGGPVDWLNPINSGGSMLTEAGMEASNQMPYGSESLDSPFARTHTKKIYALPIASSYYGSGGVGGFQAKSPYVVQCNPQVLALGGGSGGSTLLLNPGRFRDAEEKFDMNNMENGQSLPMNEGQMKLAAPSQGGRHVIHPIVSPFIQNPGSSVHSIPSVYQHSSTHQTYQTRPMYPSHNPGFMVPDSHFYRREGTPREPKTWNNETPARDTQQNPSSGMERGQQPSGGAMSPSQMLNQMRGVGSTSGGASSFGKTNPVMQSFPREHEESSPCKEGVHVNMHIPSGGQPFMLTSPRNRDDDKIATNHGSAMHDEMGKREAEKSTQ